MGILLVFGPIVLLPHLLLNSYDFFFPSLRHQHIVHPYEGFLEGLFVVLLDVALVLLQFLNKVTFYKGGYFCA